MDEIITDFANRALECYKLHRSFVDSSQRGKDDEKSNKVILDAFRSLFEDFRNHIEEAGKNTVERFISEVRASPHKQ